MKRTEEFCLTKRVRLKESADMKENPIYLKRGRNVETQIFSLSQHDILAAHFLCVCIYI